MWLGGELLGATVTQVIKLHVGGQLRFRQTMGGEFAKGPAGLLLPSWAHPHGRGKEEGEALESFSH